VAACEQVKSVIVADDAAGTVTMTLASSWGPFLPTIAQTWGSVMDMEWVAENGGWDGSCDTWQNFYAMTSAEDPFTGIANGTGPFKLDHVTPGEETVLVRNDSYWSTPAQLERVVILDIAEFGTRFAMLQAGDADTAAISRQDTPQVDPLAGEVCTWNLDSASYDCEIVDESLPLRLRIGRPGLVQDVVIFNFALATEGNNYVGSGQLDGNGIPADFFNDVHIRKGFAYAFDYDTYIADVFLGEGVQPVSLPLPGMPGYDASAAHYTYDLEAATAEFQLADLDHDGIAAGEDPEGDVWTTGFRVQMLYNLGNTSRQITAEILAAGLSEINELFSVEILGLPFPAYLTAQRNRQIPIMTAGWQEDIHDPHNWYQPYTVGAYGARQGLPTELTEQFRVLLDAGVAETDPDARHQTYLEFNQLYYDLVPGFPIVNATGHGYTQRWVEGVVLNPLFSGIYYYPIHKN
jgi:peptide/nickel transport system substrate-binding protein